MPAGRAFFRKTGRNGNSPALIFRTRRPDAAVPETGFHPEVAAALRVSKRVKLAIRRPAIQNSSRIIMESLNERQNLERFGQLVLAEPKLHDQLRAAANQKIFAALAVRLGAERGCLFTAPAVEAAVREQRRAWLERWL